MLSNSAILTALATGLFAGGALHVTLSEQPARLACGAAAAVGQWRGSCRRAALVQGPLAIIAAIAGLASWWGGGGIGWLLTGIAMGAIVVYTIVVVGPTNHALQDERLDTSSADALALVEHWGTLHAARTIVGLAAFALNLALLVG